MNGGLNVLVSSESKMNSSDESDSNVDDSDVNVSVTIFLIYFRSTELNYSLIICFNRLWIKEDERETSLSLEKRHTL